MSTLNTKSENNKKISRFSVPGFRSGSFIKKLIACVYYCFVFFYVIVNGCRTALQMDFQGATDVFLFVMFLLFAVGAFMAPVIIMGISDYYDIHGIKLILAIVALMSVCMTCAMFVSSYFSDELKGINTELEQSVSESSQNSSESEPTPELENALVKENIENSDDKTDSSDLPSEE